MERKNNLERLLGDPVVNWLLEEENPSVRYFTLTDLLTVPKSDPVAIKSYKSIYSGGPVPKILEKQNPGGYWEEPENFYMRKKYRGTVWTMLLLAELGLDGYHAALHRAAEFLFKSAQDPDTGAFAYRNKDGVAVHDAVIPCLTANMSWCLLRYGYLDDPRLQNAVRWLTTYLRFDDGEDKPPRVYPYDRFENCWGSHTCMTAVVKTLKALSQIPPNKRSDPVNQTISNGAEFILKHYLYRRSHNLSVIANPSWIELGFPLMWKPDVLEMLTVLLDLGFTDSRMQDAVDVVRSKRNPEGKWLLESSYNGRFQVRIEGKGKPSKWITLKALSAIKKAVQAGL